MKPPVRVASIFSGSICLLGLVVTHISGDNFYQYALSPGNPEGADDLVIMKVQPEDEAAFLQQYSSKIIVAGSSIQEVLIKFGQHINEQH